MGHTLTTSGPVVLIPGAWHGEWVWRSLEEQLRARGLRSIAITLPGKHRAEGEDDLFGHAEFVRNILRNLESPATVLAHSYGGAVLTQALEPGLPVHRAVFLAAFQLDVGESCLSINTPEEGSEAAENDFEVVDGYISIAQDAARAGFYSDLDEEIITDALARLTPERYETIFQPVSRAGWRDYPTSYVVCQDDRALPRHLQRKMAERADTCYELAGSHSSMISHAGEVASIVHAEALRAQR